MGLAPGKNPKMNFMKYLNIKSPSKNKYFELNRFLFEIRCYGYHKII